MSLYVTFYPVLRSSHSAEGISPAEDKKHAVLDAPVPQNIPQLRSFLGLVNYYGKFLYKLADTLAPLYQLLRKHEPWHSHQAQGYNHVRTFAAVLAARMDKVGVVKY